MGHFYFSKKRTACFVSVIENQNIHFNKPLLKKGFFVLKKYPESFSYLLFC